MATNAIGVHVQVPKFVCDREGAFDRRKPAPKVDSTHIELNASVMPAQFNTSATDLNKAHVKAIEQCE